MLTRSYFNNQITVGQWCSGQRQVTGECLFLRERATRSVEMRPGEYAIKPSLDIASVVAGMNGKKLAEESGIKADFHATIEKLLSGKEIIKVAAHRDPRLDKPNSNQFVDYKLKQLLNYHQVGDEDVPGWLVKVYENLQLQEEHPKVQTSWLLQHLTDDLISPDQNGEVTPTQYKNNDINESNSGKITANEVVQLIDDSLGLKKFDSDSKLLKPLKVQILKEKLDETLVKLKSLLTERPKGWDEMYAIHVSTVKTITNKLEEFLKEVEVAVLKEPVYDLKTKAMAMFALDAKENLKKFKQSLRQWDNLAKVILENDSSSHFPKNDDIILVERKEESAVEPPKDRD